MSRLTDAEVPDQVVNVMQRLKEMFLSSPGVTAEACEEIEQAVRGLADDLQAARAALRGFVALCPDVATLDAVDDDERSGRRPVPISPTIKICRQAREALP